MAGSLAAIVRQNVKSSLSLVFVPKSCKYYSVLVTEIIYVFGVIKIETSSFKTHPSMFPHPAILCVHLTSGPQYPHAAAPAAAAAADAEVRWSDGWRPERISISSILVIVQFHHTQHTLLRVEYNARTLKKHIPTQRAYVFRRLLFDLTLPASDRPSFAGVGTVPGCLHCALRTSVCPGCGCGCE